METCWYCNDKYNLSDVHQITTDRGEEVYVCEHCCENIRYCDDCGRALTDGYTVNPDRRDERVVCSGCLDNYVYCDCCEEYYSDNHIEMSDNFGTSICDHCSDDYVVCEDCGRVLEYDNAYGDDGVYWCEYCYESHEDSSHLNNYSYKPYDRNPVFWKTEKDDPNLKLFFGIEQETDSGDNRVDYVNDLHEFSSNGSVFVMKEDCSLENGVEIVSYPCSFNYLMEKYPFEQIRDTARKYDYVSHDSGNCGLHIHVSKNGLGDSITEQDLTIAKIMLLYDRFWDNIVKFSRRASTNWCHKPDADIKAEDTVAETIKKSKKNQYAHSMAVNLQHSHTVEFRIFRGTLNVNTMKASIQFVKVMVEWAMKHSLRECQSVSWQDLVWSEYPELNSYLAKRELM